MACSAYRQGEWITAVSRLLFFLNGTGSLCCVGLDSTQTHRMGNWHRLKPNNRHVYMAHTVYRLLPANRSGSVWDWTPPGPIICPSGKDSDSQWWRHPATNQSINSAYTWKCVQTNKGVPTHSRFDIDTRLRNWFNLQTSRKGYLSFQWYCNR